MQCFLLVLLVLGAAVVTTGRRLTRFLRGNEAPNEANASDNEPSREIPRSGRSVGNNKRKLLVRGLSASACCSNSRASIPVRLLVELAQRRLGGGGGGGGSGGTGGAAGAPAPVVLATWVQRDGKVAAKVEMPSELAEQLMRCKDSLQLIPGIRISPWAPGRRAQQGRSRAATQQWQEGAAVVAAAAAAAVREVLHQPGHTWPPGGMPPMGYLPPPAPLGWHCGMHRPMPMPMPMWHPSMVQQAGGMEAPEHMQGAAATATAEQQAGSPRTPAAPPDEAAPVSSALAAAARFMAEVQLPRNPPTPATPSQGSTPQQDAASGTAGSAAASPAAADGHVPAFPPHKNDLSFIRTVRPGSHRQHRGVVYVLAEWYDSYVAESQLEQGTLQEYWEQQGGRPAHLPPLPGKKAAASKPAQKGKRAAAAPAARAAVAATPAAAAKAAARIALNTPACGWQRTRQATRLAAAAQTGSNQQ